MNYLNGGETFTLGKSFPGSIVFARDLTPTDIAEAGSAFVHGFVCEKGSATSHAAIVAKAKGIPFVTNVNFESAKCLNGDVVIVDGRSGDIILNPSPETLRRYQDMQLQLQLHVKNLTKSKQLESETYDGYAIKLSANIEMVSELEMIHQYGGNGVGLFRSEYICLANNKFPSEDEQFEIYKNVVEKMLGLPIVIRTFDIGGDKLLGNSHFNKESHSFLGCRAIRFLLKEREIFKAQLKAIIRASVYGKVSILFPMISTLSELIEAKQVVKEVQVELEKKKIQYHPHIRIGCMIEVITDLLAKECDFLSIGTNDLVQYSLAADRGNHAMSGFYTPTHPSVIRLIKLVVSEANINGIPVTICGEVAADPRFTSLLLGLGVHELSVASRYIPIIKNAIRNTSIVAATKLAEEALRLATANEIQELINQEYMKNVPDAFFYNF
jgi:phosphotransferase system enzyme I (PtsI)